MCPILKNRSISFNIFLTILICPTLDNKQYILLATFHIAFLPLTIYSYSKSPDSCPTLDTGQYILLTTFLIAVLLLTTYSSYKSPDSSPTLDKQVVLLMINKSKHPFYNNPRSCPTIDNVI